MFTIIDSTGFGMTVTKGTVLSFILVTLAVNIALYILRSIGVYTLSKRAGVKTAWLGWIPCVWVYPLFKVLKNEHIFGMNFSSCAVAFTVIFAVSHAFTFACNFLEWFPYIGYYMQGGNLLLDFSALDIYPPQTGNDFINPFDTSFVKVIMNVMKYSNIPLELIALVLEVFMFVDLFKKYWPNNYILGSILSCLGLFGPFVFAIRNKPQVDYNQYIRNRYSRYYNPYGPNQYGRPQQPNSPGQEDPFGDFSSKDQDPFSEFDNDKDKDK